MSDHKLNRVLFSSNNNLSDNVVPIFSKEELNGMPIWSMKDNNGNVRYFEENGKAIKFK